MELNQIALQIATKVIKNFEGCCLRAYPDPASPLYHALTANGMYVRYVTGKLLHKDLPDNFKALSGAPFTIGYGETQGVNIGDVWTQEEADSRLASHIQVFMSEALSVSPKLAGLKPEQIAAVTSLVYNIGITNYKTSTVAKMIAAGDMRAAAEAFLLWNKAGGYIVQGLVNRRKVESDLFMSGV